MLTLTDDFCVSDNQEEEEEKRKPILELYYTWKELLLHLQIPLCKHLIIIFLFFNLFLILGGIEQADKNAMYHNSGSTDN